eukprot:TRINITY_DN668_c0_g1_i13.p1 TRINITY_DN668_c0_g1~~TRINITY_DN668_c0_g1_i13.p1  ORF type:complete len:210 (-),score=15.92 TRINITY_DN668_c0_g1_i13:728-1357(-)
MGVVPSRDHLWRVLSSLLSKVQHTLRESTGLVVLAVDLWQHVTSWGLERGSKQLHWLLVLQVHPRPCLAHFECQSQQMCNSDILLQFFANNTRTKRDLPSGIDLAAVVDVHELIQCNPAEHRQLFPVLFKFFSSLILEEKSTRAPVILWADQQLVAAARAFVRLHVPVSSPSRGHAVILPGGFHLAGLWHCVCFERTNKRTTHPLPWNL